MTLLIAGSNPVRTFFVSGPPGQPTLMSPVVRGAPSRNAAALAAKQVVDTMQAMRTTAEDPNALCSVTDVPADFWIAWYAQNEDNEVCTYRLVYPLGY